MSIVWFSDLKGNRHGVNTDNLCFVYKDQSRTGSHMVFLQFNGDKCLFIDTDIEVVEAAIRDIEPKFVAGEPLMIDESDLYTEDTPIDYELSPSGKPMVFGNVENYTPFEIPPILTPEEEAFDKWIGACCKFVDDDIMTSASDLWNSYESWAWNRFPSLSRTTLGVSLRDRAKLSKIKVRGLIHYMGIELVGVK